MPVTFKNDKNEIYFVSVWEGGLSNNGFINSYIKYLEGPNWNGAIKIIC